MTGALCIVRGCKRTPPRGSRICGSCWRWVSMPTRLALEAHVNDAWEKRRAWGVPARGEEADTWLAFVRWSYNQTVSLAAAESHQLREQQALEDLRARRAELEEAEATA